MNLNKLIKELLSMATGFPVEQDEYSGKSDKYIVFTYVNERPEVFADNKGVLDVALMQIQLVTPKSFNYFAMKQKIRDALEDSEFVIESITSFLGDKYSGSEKIRQTVFEVSYYQSR